MKDNAPTETFIKRAQKVHGETYDYSKVVYVKAKTKVTIGCPRHGDFTKTPDKHLRGQGCPRCSKEAQNKASTLSKEDFVRQARAVHGGRYGYDFFDYKKKITPGLIECPDHGLFLQSAHNHVNGQGCPECGQIPQSQFQVRDLDWFIGRVKEVTDLEYDFSLAVYKGHETKLDLICPNGHIFSKTPRDLLTLRKCHKCRELNLLKYFIYLFRLEDGVYKIGISDEPCRRMKKYLTDFPETVLVATWPVEDFKEALRQERNIFKRLPYPPAKSLSMPGFTETFESAKSTEALIEEIDHCRLAD